jgi:hypothetical protein
MLGTIPENFAMACIFVFEKYSIKLSKTRSVQLGSRQRIGEMTANLQSASLLLIYNDLFL